MLCLPSRQSPQHLRWAASSQLGRPCWQYYLELGGDFKGWASVYGYVSAHAVYIFTGPSLIPPSLLHHQTPLLHFLPPTRNFLQAPQLHNPVPIWTKDPRRNTKYVYSNEPDHLPLSSSRTCCSSIWRSVRLWILRGGPKHRCFRFHLRPSFHDDGRCHPYRDWQCHTKQHIRLFHHDTL